MMYKINSDMVDLAAKDKGGKSYRCLERVCIRHGESGRNEKCKKFVKNDECYVMKF
jgi:hypothetical protein